MYYENEIVTLSKRELHALIADAVREGVLAAMKESGKGFYPDSERPAEKGGFIEPRLKTPTPDGKTENAEAYIPQLRKECDRYCHYLSLSQKNEIMDTMYSLFSEEEVRYILTHIAEGYKPSNEHEFNDNVRSLISFRAARNAARKK